MVKYNDSSQHYQWFQDMWGISLAVLYHDPCVSGSQNSESSNGSTPMVEGDLQQPNNDSSNTTDMDRIESFTAEEEFLYQTRYSEGYDLNDPKYIFWLKINHRSEDCDKFSNLMLHFPNASIPEEIPVSLDSASTDDNTALESDDQLVEPVDVCEAILPGLTPSRKDGSGTKSVSRTLVMEIPVTVKENESTSATTLHISTMFNNGSNPLSSSLVSSVMDRSPSFMSSSSTPPICTSSTSTPISNSSSTPPIRTSSTSTPITNSSSTPPIHTSPLLRRFPIPALRHPLVRHPLTHHLFPI